MSGGDPRSSRLPGFYRLSLAERRRVAADALGIEPAALARALEDGGLGDADADKLIENVIGTFSLPFALGLNFRVDGRDHVVPMVVEEPSVVAAASNAARLVRAAGGFETGADEPVMTAQIQLDDVPDPAAAAARVRERAGALLEQADTAVTTLVERGGGARDLDVRELGDGLVVVHVHVDCRDAMGANLVNTVAEHLAPHVAEITGGRIGCRILTNLCDRRRVRARAVLPEASLSMREHAGPDVAEAIARASRFAERDPYRAATHNKGVLNGIDAVAVATANDWRAVEAGAHAWAARSGAYRPLSTWRREDGHLIGELELPLALGTVGGARGVHEGARLALGVLGVDGATQLARVAACVGLASNLAALRALGTVGIQRGHMALHARTVAVSAGARGEDVERVAAEIHGGGEVSRDAARRVLRSLLDARAPAGARG